ncbi:uncharacterized protein LOC124156886 [Ischnura elegans]|uniref:uncharacterized protein LOC124156886 n=1 Tax=Ischnura elegans TaxID=197161 RepID=UPI001ED87D88|nr:uncharacterized protein LOC124156886 [Ischnura elegans]
MRWLHWSDILPLLAVLLTFGLEVYSEDNSVQISPQVNTPAIEFPVQLIGFPVIIVAVRLSNFVKKLAYSLNPRTYVKRSKRGALAAGHAGHHQPQAHVIEDLDPSKVEEQLVKEMGTDVCVYEKVCEEYAMTKEVAEHEGQNTVIDWPEVVSKYELTPEKSKKFYLLSVFLGDIVASPKLCHELVKRGRACTT